MIEKCKDISITKVYLEIVKAVVFIMIGIGLTRWLSC